MIRLPYETMPEKIYFFRHGQSIGNAIGMYDESLKDTPNHMFHLTEKGESQAKSLGEYIRKNNILDDVKDIYASNFLRAQQTLEIVLKESHLPNPKEFYKDSRLDEWWKGIFYTLTDEEINRYYPKEKTVRDREGWHHYRPPQGEAGKDVESRLMDFFSMLKVNSMISGHGRTGGFIRRLLCSEPMHINCRYLHPKNCELWLFQKKENLYELKSLFKPEHID